MQVSSANIEFRETLGQTEILRKKLIGISRGLVDNLKYNKIPTKLESKSCKQLTMWQKCVSVTFGNSENVNFLFQFLDEGRSDAGLGQR